MSRLLQALKNLEARSSKPAAGQGVLAHLADKFHRPAADPPKPAAAEAARPAKPTAIKLRTPENPLAYLSVGVPTILLQPPPAAELEFPAADSFSPVFVNESVQPLVAPREDYFPPAPPAAPAAAEYSPPPAPAYEAARSEPAPVEEFAPREPVVESPQLPSPPLRQATLIERTVRRTLADPERSEPFRQLAERLWSDLAQSSGRTVLLTGVGPASETHEVILHAAALLAERGEPIVVVDADAAHRTLTCQLDFPDRGGLAELSLTSYDALTYIQPTTFDGLSVLPFGKARLGDPALCANRLSAAMQTLEASHRLVLIDGGRSSELAAATLARLSDATYFVIRLGETEAALAQAAVRDFRAAGARVLGCIATS